MKFIKIFFLVILLSANLACDQNSQSGIVKWNSEEGIKRLNRSEFKNDFYQLADHFQPQINPLYCGIASSVIILNAINEGQIASQEELEVVKPKAFGGGKIAFNSYSQLTFLNDKTDKVKDRKVIKLQNITAKNENDAKNFDAGLTLRQLSEILEKIYGLNTNITYAKKADENSINLFRKQVREITADKKKYLLANFKGKDLKLKTGGHISPIVAFDQKSDSVLMMDVAGHKNSWYWVKISDLYKAMNSKDGDNYRGYLIILSSK